MRFIDEYRDKELVRRLSQKIREASTKKIRLMEFCGGHTETMLKYGIKDFLPENIKLVSGPGCPVCVTSAHEIDTAVALSKRPDIIIASYGDMIRVPGSTISLRHAISEGADIRIVYSVYDSLQIARFNKDKKIVFISIGFETTIPTAAAALIAAGNQGIDNFYILCAHKTTPGILNLLLEAGPDIDGFICPGHVSTIIGTEVYRPAVEKYHKPCVVAGFEPLDVLQTIFMLARQLERNEAKLEIEYLRAVKPEGNQKAVSIMQEVFRPCDAEWRGIGIVPGTGLILADKYKKYDALQLADTVPESAANDNCVCGKILMGFAAPPDCGLFRTRCTPETPVGACMVSSEGTCAAYYKYY